MEILPCEAISMIADHFHSEPSIGVRSLLFFASSNLFKLISSCSFGYVVPIRLNLSRELLLCVRTNERTVVRQTVHSMNCHSWDHYNAYRAENIYFVHKITFVQQWASAN